tara:strand:- start:10945 stop:11475 length:531 start_codon:yes stop_codon:yes gene_type:complete
MEAYYSHKEYMKEHKITLNDLPNDLKDYVKKFNNKSRNAKHPDIIQDLQAFSELLKEKMEELGISNEQTIEEIKEELENKEINLDDLEVKENQIEDKIEEIEEPEVQKMEKGGEISIEEQIKADEKAVAEVCDTDNSEEIQKSEPIVEEKSDVIEKINRSSDESDNSWGLNNIFNW